MAKAKRSRTQSQYDQYRLPFFDKARRLTWAAKPSGDYRADCELGRKYARQFLASCDGTEGWNTLLGQVVSDIVRMAGPEQKRPDGSISCGGVVVGFFGEISRALALSELTKRPVGVMPAAKRRGLFRVIDGRADNGPTHVPPDKAA